MNTQDVVATHQQYIATEDIEKNITQISDKAIENSTGIKQVETLNIYDKILSIITCTK